MCIGLSDWVHLSFSVIRRTPCSSLFPYTTLFRSRKAFLRTRPKHQCTAEPPHAVRDPRVADHVRSEEHTSELQSQSNLVCRLLLEKKKKIHTQPTEFLIQNKACNFQYN